MIKLLHHGPFWPGSTALHRLEAFRQLKDVEVFANDSSSYPTKHFSWWFRARWKMKLPIDIERENQTLIQATEEYSPNVVLVENSKVVRRKTLKILRSLGVNLITYYTPDDIIGSHNLSLPLRKSLPEWDILFTTKTFNIPELKGLGVKRPTLVGTAYHATLHQPIDPKIIGNDFEKYDVVFIGAFEKARAASLKFLSEQGISVLLSGKWNQDYLHPNITSIPPQFHEEYVKTLHFGKISLCFLRKLNRDLITTRSLEIPACGRPMVAEKTKEHDEYFLDGTEYLGFRDDLELLEKVNFLLKNEDKRLALGKAGLDRCTYSGYSTIDRAKEMMEVIRSL
jgi:spore maturation protein CgeB